MPKFDPSKPRGEVTFQCRPCRETFDAPPRVEDDPEAEPHPFRYFAKCPKCKAEVPQAPWDRALQKAWLNATGPRTAEGKAATAKNLEGHPTPDEAVRTRFNALKHGMNARTATYFPARPDGYAFCKTCDVNRDWCKAQPACAKKTEIFMMHHAAFEQKDPKKLTPLYADMQAAMFALVQTIVQTIIADGATLTTPEYYTDKDGKICFAEYMEMREGHPKYGEWCRIDKLERHPLFQPLGELLSKNNMSLADMGMTVKVIEQGQDDEMGRLSDKGTEPELLDDFRRRTEASLAAIADKVDRGRAQRERDPVLLEYDQGTGEAKPVSPA